MKKYLLTLPLALMGVGTLSAQTADSLSIQRLEEVAVVGTRATERTPMAYSNIGRETLAKHNLGVDLPYLLQMQPSTFSTSDAGTGIGYTSLRVRGVDATGINITIGGVPINDSESQAVFWVNMPDLASSVRQVQVQRGVGTSSNGAASFGASVNMALEALSVRPYGSISLSGGSFNTLRANGRFGTGRIAKHWSIDGRVSYITSDGYVDRSGVRLMSYFLQRGYASERTMVKLLSFGGSERTGIAWNGISTKEEEQFGRTYNSAGYKYTDADGRRHYHDNTDNYLQLHNHLVVSHRFSPVLSLNATLHYTRGYGYTHEYRTGRTLVKFGLQPYLDQNGKKVKKTSLLREKYLDNHFYGMVSSLSWTPERWQIHLGVSGNEYRGAHYGILPWVDYPTPVSPTKRYYDNDAKKLDFSTYIKAQYQLTNALSAYVDLQYRHVDYQIDGTTDNYDEGTSAMQVINLKRTFNFLNPKAGLFYQFNPEHHAYASVAISHREPNRKTYTEGAVGVEPRAERLTDYELGYGYKGRLYSLSVGGYYMHYTDQLVMNGKINDVGGMILENVPESYRMGIELQGAARLTNSLHLDASVGLSQNRIKRYEYNFSQYDADYNWQGYVLRKYDNATLAYSPSLIFSGALTYTTGDGFEAALRSQYVSSQYLDNTASADRMLPAYHTMGLRLSYDLRIKGAKGLNVTLEANNILDSRYYSNGYVYDVGLDHHGKEYSDLRYYPQAGLNVLVGTTLTF